MQMLFSILTPQGEIRNLRYDSSNFDIALDVLNLYVSRGNVLLAAKIVETNGANTHLPIEAFDGTPVGVSFMNLQNEYDLILCVGKGS